MFRLLYLHLYPLVTFHTGNDMHLHILGVLSYRPSIIIQSPFVCSKSSCLRLSASFIASSTLFIIEHLSLS